MHRLVLLLLPAVVGACGSSWSVRDEDGDGKSILEGDCFDSPEGGGNRGPEAGEVWYDGIDQNCDGKSDFDKDGDGFDAIEHGGTDCWDDSDILPDEFEAINGFPALTAADVYPDAVDTFYDAVDANCDGQSDFDADGDGFDTSNSDYVQRDGTWGDDCYDSVELDDYPASGTLASDFLPEEINSAQTDTWYDGTDQDCDGWSDYDQDRDGFDISGECDDENAAIFPNPSIPEEWYDDEDENCDGNKYDKDLDGHLHVDFGGDDCWDDYDNRPDAFVVIPGFTQPNADQVYPGAIDAPYDAVDGNCEGDSDFDADDDGYDADDKPNRDGVFGSDCDDDESTSYPGADDTWYDGIDADCAGNSDYDVDGDGFDSPAITTGTDCDDTNAEANPGQNEDCATDFDDNCDGGLLDLLNADNCETFYLDADDDGYGSTTTQCWCEPQVATDYDAIRNDDCNDAVSAINPGATEICDDANTDEDCDSTADNNDASAAESGKTLFFHDDDEDGYGDLSHAGARYCDNPTTGSQSWVTDNTDCDDVDGGDHPGATEIVGNQDDESCDGTESCYDDDDNDGFLDTTSDTRTSSDTDCTDANEGTNTDPTTDCNDSVATVYPGATEVVGDGVDQSCDGSETCYDDDDNDGYLDTTADTRVSADADCADANEGTNTDPTTDCNDAVATINPGATEVVGDGIDQTCDGTESCFDDDDNDGYLDTSADTRTSSDADCNDANEGTNTDPTTDCNDTVATINPGATEIVGDGVDQTCNGQETCYDDDDNDGYLDTTGDTRNSTDADCTDANEGTNTDPTTDCNDAVATINPGATEVVGDGIDQTCDGTETCYDDDDNDGYLDSSGDTRTSSDADCSDANEGTNTDLTTDCNDAVATINPGATEVVGDGVDQTCNGQEICYEDDDNDGQLDTSGDTRTSTDADCADANEGTNTDATTDCNDAVATIYLGAAEVVGDGVDQSCDGTETCYEDDDNDGQLDTSGDTRTSSDADCSDANEGTNTDATTDCNDAVASIYLGATEVVGDGVDQSCDGSETCYDDGDNDGYLDTSNDTRVSADADCADANEGTNTDPTTDCNDAAATVYPGATEVVGDGIDQSCDGTETCYDDDDNDGFLDTSGDTRPSADLDCADANEGTSSDATTDCDDTDAYAYPGAPEYCDGQQNDCSTSWTEGDEDGVVSLVTTGGVWSDASSSFDDATATVYALPASGTLYFCAGTYNTKLEAASSSTASVVGFYGAAVTTLNNNSGSGPTVKSSGSTITLDGLTISGGLGTSVSSETYGGGVLANTAARVGNPNVKLIDCVVEGNDASRGGGVAAYSHAWIRLEGTTIEGHAADEGGGAWVSAEGLLEVAEGSSIVGNSAIEGGGVYVSAAGELTVEGDSTIADNSASADGGGIWMEIGEVVCDDSAIYGNEAGGHGGGVFIYGDGTFESIACDFAGTTDNAPSDVEIRLTGSSWATYAAYGATASFVCNVTPDICE